MKYLMPNKKEKHDLEICLPSYKLKNVLIRFAAVNLIAIGVLHFISVIFKTPDGINGYIPLKIYIVTILGFYLAAELQIVFDNILERFLPVPKKIRLRVILQMSVGIIFIFFAHRILKLFIDPKVLDENTRAGVMIGLLAGLLFVQMIANSLTVARFTRKWINTQEQIARMKREKLKMDYYSLQDQLNPHFLFNNLSVLKSLIIYDQDAAVAFTENFTDVYRYVLQSKEKRLVKIAEEIEFIKAYFSLHKERLGDKIKIVKSIDEKQLDREIAPLTCQLLFENAIKHNVASRETPLVIHATINEDYIIVGNNLNLRTSSYSTKTGLKNLVRRYKMLTSKEIIIKNNEEYFEVKVPLL